MCKYCQRNKGKNWENQIKFQNTEEEFLIPNKRRIWCSSLMRNNVYAVIHNYKGITPNYDGKNNGSLFIEIPDINESISININYCPFCGDKLGEVENKYI